MPTIHDEEFGNITIRRSARASQVRVRVAPDGSLRASLPLYAPIFLVKRLLKTSRDELRTIVSEARPTTIYENGMIIGKSHSLIVRPILGDTTRVSIHGQQILVHLPPNQSLNDDIVARLIRENVIAAMRKEAKSYLPKRLAFLADKYSYSYQRVRFSHASGRWGSCSSSGTISLNIALMKLPFELIDYVIFHELSHTKQMNHSQEFWDQVGLGDPKYRIHRQALKLETPSI